MKLNRLLLVSLLAGAAPFAAHAAPAPVPADDRVELVFFEPKHFTDVKDSAMSDNPAATGYLDQLRDYFLSQARNYVPAGWHLTVTFTDIDMAGDFEPWRGPRFDDVRIVKDIYPPRMVFSFRLTDAEGNVVKQGDRKLLDTAFQLHGAMQFKDDPLRYEKAMLDDWLSSEFQRVKS